MTRKEFYDIELGDKFIMNGNKYRVVSEPLEGYLDRIICDSYVGVPLSTFFYEDVKDIELWDGVTEEGN